VLLEELDQLKGTVDLIGNRIHILQVCDINERVLLDDSCRNVYPGSSH
jgi:hypothetical protein